MKQDDDLRKSIVQQIMQKSTEMRRIIVPVEGSHCRACPHIVTDTRLQITSGRSRWGTVTAVKGENNAAGAARLAAATSVGRTRTESVVQDSAGPSEAKVIRARAPPQGQCGTLMCAQTFLANLQTGGQLGGHDLRRSARGKAVHARTKEVH